MHDEIQNIRIKMHEKTAKYAWKMWKFARTENFPAICTNIFLKILLPTNLGNSFLALEMPIGKQD